MTTQPEVTWRAAVLGSPIGHSLSPVLHRAAYAALGLTGWDYRAVECDEAALPGFLAGLDGSWRGLSLTMPLKRAVIPLLASVSPLATAVGAVNTVTWPRRDRPHGDNTDVHGIVAALASGGVTRAGTACVLGAGATACSAIAALAELGCRTPLVQARSAARAGDLLAAAERLSIRPVLTGLDRVTDALAADVVICTLPGEAGATWAAGLPAGERPAGVLLDVSYHPWPTAAAGAWQAAGGGAVGGFEMLLHQAAEQVRLMTGQPAPLAAMREAGLAELGRRAQSAPTGWTAAALRPPAG